jgi:hypothetical protein
MAQISWAFLGFRVLGFRVSLVDGAGLLALKGFGVLGFRVSLVDGAGHLGFIRV